MSTEKEKPNVGKTIHFEAFDEPVLIRDENETAVYVDCEFFTGWIPKTAECENGETLAEILE